MKKLLARDKKRRSMYAFFEKKITIFKHIFKNLNFFVLVRLNAYLGLQSFSLSKSSFSNRCMQNISKKRFNKFTLLSRNVFLKFIRKGYFSGLKKSSW